MDPCSAPLVLMSGSFFGAMTSETIALIRPGIAHQQYIGRTWDIIVPHIMGKVHNATRLRCVSTSARYSYICGKASVDLGPTYMHRLFSCSRKSYQI